MSAQRSRWREWLCVVLAFANPLHAAEQVCYRWFAGSAGIDGQYFSSASATLSASVAARNASPETGGSGVSAYTTVYAADGCDATPPTGSSGQRTCTYTKTRQPTAGAIALGGGCSTTVSCTTSTHPMSVSYEIDPAGCPEDPCDELAGQRFTQWGTFTGIPELGVDYSTSLAQNGCNVKAVAATGCHSVGGGQYFCGVTMQYGPQTNTPDPTPPSDEGECALFGGKTDCGLHEDPRDVPDPTQCVVIANERLCFSGLESSEGEEPPDSGCWRTPDGGLLCGEDKELRDEQNNIIEPDGSIGGPSGTNYYYSSSTVTNVHNGVTVDRDVDGDGDVNEEEEGGTASGGGTCAAPPSCSGNSVMCAILSQSWKSRCPDGPTEAELQGIFGTNPSVATEAVDVGSLSETEHFATGGSCPAPPTFQFMGNTIELTGIVTLCAFADKISIFTMAGAYLTALFILMGHKEKES